LKRLIAALSSGAVGAALLVLAAPAAPVGATVDIVQGYNCTGGVAANVTITGAAAVSGEETPASKEKVKVKNVLFTVTNPFGVAITVKHIAVTVPDPATVTFVGGSTAGGPAWVFTHAGGISTDTHLAVIPVVPAGGTFSSALMKIDYLDNGTDPPGPGVINWFGGTVRFKVTVPAIGNVVCVPGAPVAFATVLDGV
jgi:hypothetical protein